VWWRRYSPLNTGNAKRGTRNGTGKDTYLPVGGQEKETGSGSSLKKGKKKPLVNKCLFAAKNREEKWPKGDDGSSAVRGSERLSNPSKGDGWNVGGGEKWQAIGDLTYIKTNPVGVFTS